MMAGEVVSTMDYVCMAGVAVASIAAVQVGLNDQLEVIH